MFMHTCTCVAMLTFDIYARASDGQSDAVARITGCACVASTAINVCSHQPKPAQTSNNYQSKCDTR